MNNPSPRPIRVAIVEDHDDFRESVYHVLQGTEGFTCVGKFCSLEDAMRRLPESDVLLLDINLPGKSGIEGIASVKKLTPKTQVVMFTVYEDDATIMQAIRAGADGYLLKKTPPVRLLQAIEEAASGGMPMTPFVARQAIAAFRRHLPSTTDVFDLTPREQEVLGLLAQGFSYGKVGESLFISIDTVRNHVRNIYQKLQVSSKAEAVAKATKRGLV